MSERMTAKKLRLILVIVILLILAVIIGGFAYAEKTLKGYATQISRLNADANSGDKNIETLRKLEDALQEKQAAVTNAHSLVAESASYRETTIADITRIAKQSGVSITSIEFTDSATATNSTPQPTGTTTTPTQPVAPSGVTKKTISVEILSPIRYSSLMNFIRSIETNPLKMQIATVNMSKAESDLVGTQSFVIGVYVR